MRPIFLWYQGMAFSPLMVASLWNTLARRVGGKTPTIQGAAALEAGEGQLTSVYNKSEKPVIDLIVEDFLDQLRSIIFFYTNHRSRSTSIWKSRDLSNRHNINYGT